MCGIAGFINCKVDREKLAKSFMESIRHRGPDNQGKYSYENATIINTRLSIIDLDLGNQPFISSDNQIGLVQNGEIYNYLEVKYDLQKKGYEFKTNSDTEVILNSYLHYGDKFVNYLNGMFSIAIIDKRKQKLFLYRDRLGVKPLYIYQKDGTILFSSEIKTFNEYPSFDKSINYQSIHNYLIYNYIPLPETIFTYVHHVKPGYYFSICLKENKIYEQQYWNIKNKEEDIKCSEEEYLEIIEKLLYEGTKIRLRSDVPIGAFLSGGLDSSIVCAYAKDISQQKFNTYTIGFNEKKYDETKFAKYIADKYKLINKVKILDEDIISLWNKVTWYNDQPHGDISFIPTYILSKFASKDLKVVLTGDGGDELFAGYTKYLTLLDYKAQSDEYFNSISLFYENKNLNFLYSPFLLKQINIRGAKHLYCKILDEVSQLDNINKGLYFDVKQLLPGNNLVKTDKMSMANSLETRSPFLDYNFYEVIFSISGYNKLKPKETKHLLKKICLKHFNYNHVYRKKQMFTVPVGEWFKLNRGKYLLSITKSKKFIDRNLFNYKIINQMVENHINERINYTRELRAIVNLEIWFRNFID